MSFQDLTFTTHEASEIGQMPREEPGDKKVMGNGLTFISKIKPLKSNYYLS